MSLDSNLQSVLTRQGTEFKALRILISGSGTGNVDGLDTTATNLVDAINEVLDVAEAGGSMALDDLTDVVITAGAAADFLRHNGTNWVDSPIQAVDLSVPIHAATNKATPVGADELALIDSEAANVLKRLTISALATYVTSLIVDGAPGTLDTLNELAAALQDNPDVITDILADIAAKQDGHANLTALAGLSLVADRLPYANGAGTLALTTFTAAARGLLDDASVGDMRTTLDVWSKAEVGPVTTDYVAVFEAALT